MGTYLEWGTMVLHQTRFIEPVLLIMQLCLLLHVHCSIDPSKPGDLKECFNVCAAYRTYVREILIVMLAKLLAPFSHNYNSHAQKRSYHSSNL